jgi:hypothetical protein
MDILTEFSHLVVSKPNAIKKEIIKKPVVEFLTAREEWDAHYCGTRISLNALENKKRKHGSQKKLFSDIKWKTGVSPEPGPYYDPCDTHVHLWKKSINIPNFTCEQRKNVPNVEIIEDSDLKASYCCICHIKKIAHNVKILRNIDFVEPKAIFSIPPKKFTSIEKLHNLAYKYYWKKKLNETHEYVPIIGAKSEKEGVKWYRIVYKMLHKPIVYNISPFYSILKYPWELTNYQKFMINNPTYRQDYFMILNPPRDYSINYAVIE